MNKPVAFRMPQDLIDQAEKIAVQLQQTNLSDFGGMITKSQVIRRAIRLGLAELESQLNPNQ